MADQSKAQPRADVTAEFIRSIVHYDPDTGIFTRIKKMRADDVIGKVLGTITKNGYIHICIKNRLYLAQRLAWFYMTREWPVALVDHKDTDKTNNRWKNLRAATKTENGQNSRKSRRNPAGLKGAQWFKRTQQWRSRIVVNGRELSLGYFATAEEAHAAYKEAAQKHFGEFARFK